MIQDDSRNVFKNEYLYIYIIQYNSSFVDFVSRFELSILQVAHAWWTPRPLCGLRCAAEPRPNSRGCPTARPGPRSSHTVPWLSPAWPGDSTEDQEI